MRIGVNAVPLRASGGGARYVFTELMERLLTLDHENEYVIFSHFLGLGVVNQLTRLHPHLHPDSTAYKRVRVVEVIREDDIFQYRDEFDLFFGPLNNLQPRIYDRPSVAILHDIQEQYFPEYFSESDLRARREIYPEICRSATILVTISEFCKRSIVEKFGIDPDKIEVVHNAPQSGLVNRDAADEGTWNRQPLPARFFFYPANSYLHKNHALLLDALAALRKRGYGEIGAVFTGFELPGGFPLRRETKARGLEDACRVLNEVSVDELRYLYRHALALVMPTRFEGFGMPAAEALACGCPVVCSDLEPLREVAGEHALYFECDNLPQLVERLEKLLRDEPLRRRLATSGPSAAGRFSWDGSAGRMMEIFRMAHARSCGVSAASQKEKGGAHNLPRIGIVISATRGGQGVTTAIKEVWSTGYPNTAIRVIIQENVEDDMLADFLNRTGIRLEKLAPKERVTWEHLRRFAEEEQLDLVGELTAWHGNLLPAALHFLAQAYGRQPDKVLYVGEAWETEQGRIGRCARLRQLDTGDWKLEEFLYPEMLYIAPRNLAPWGEGESRAKGADRQWRWALLKEAHLSGRLCLMRHTLAICDPSHISMLDRYRALRAGMDAVHSGGRRPRLGPLLLGLKPVLRPASRLLPKSLRARIKRIWQRLTEDVHTGAPPAHQRP